QPVDRVCARVCPGVARPVGGSVVGGGRVAGAAVSSRSFHVERGHRGAGARVRACCFTWNTRRVWTGDSMVGRIGRVSRGTPRALLAVFHVKQRWAGGRFT